MALLTTSPACFPAFAQAPCPGTSRRACSGVPVTCAASGSRHQDPQSATAASSSSPYPHPAAASAASVSRRLALSAATLSGAAALQALLSPSSPQWALAAPPQSLPPSDDASIKLCDPECETNLEELPLQTLPSGLQYRDIVVGKGPSPPVGFQVAADYVAMVPSGRVFDSSLEKKAPYIFRVGAGQVVAGLDEGILSMAVGGLRRLYVPGNLSFPKGLPAGPGRPRVAPSSPVIFDVKLLYIPGLEIDEEE